jgi:hypothetical protein
MVRLQRNREQPGLRAASGLIARDSRSTHSVHPRRRRTRVQLVQGRRIRGASSPPRVHLRREPRSGTTATSGHHRTNAAVRRPSRSLRSGRYAATGWTQRVHGCCCLAIQAFCPRCPDSCRWGTPMQSIGQVRQENFAGDAILFRLFHTPPTWVETSAHRTAIVVGFVVATRRGDG